VERSIMHNMRSAISHLLHVLLAASCGSLILGIAAISSIPALAQKSEMQLDLRTAQPQEQQGLGLPEIGSSGLSGESSRPYKYVLPLQVRIMSASVDGSGDFDLEVEVKNIGRTTIELPISRNISDFERKSGSFRREFLFGIRPVGSGPNVPPIIGVTVGSHAVPQSLVRLETQQSIRVLLRVESGWVRGALPKDKNVLSLHVTCDEWALKDDRYSIEFTAKQVLSLNTASLGFNDSTPTTAVSEP